MVMDWVGGMVVKKGREKRTVLQIFPKIREERPPAKGLKGLKPPPPNIAAMAISVYLLYQFCMAHFQTWHST